MDLGLHHQIVLLELDPETGKRRSGDPTLQTYCLAAAAFAELQLQGRVVATGANRFAIQEAAPTPPGALGYADSCVGGRPQDELRKVGRIGQWSRKLRWQVLEELEAAGAVRQEADTLWILRWRTRWPEQDGTAERTLVDHLRHWLATVRPEDPPGRNDLLLSLVRAAKLLPVVWRESELDRLRPLIEERTARAPIGKTAKQASDNAKAAAAAAAAGT